MVEGTANTVQTLEVEVEEGVQENNTTVHAMKGVVVAAADLGVGVSFEWNVFADENLRERALLCLCYCSLFLCLVQFKATPVLCTEKNHTRVFQIIMNSYDNNTNASTYASDMAGSALATQTKTSSLRILFVV